ncbi:MAG TPA: SIS domain-containing protein [Clostridiales bacterium]|nr:SIS domain-containing protein [Clostridiales bacterium]
MTLMEKEILQQPQVLKNCIDYNRQIFSEVSKAIKQKTITNVVIAARGSSNHAANYFKYAFESLAKIPVSLAAPGVNTMYNAELDLSSCLAIGVSQSGMAADVTAVLENGVKCGALTLSVTNNLESKMAKMTDFHLYCNAEKELSVAATKTFTAQMCLLGYLAAYHSQNDQVQKELTQIGDNLQNIFDLKPQIQDLAQKYKDLNSLIVLGRGTNYPIALETALKIQETTYINARACAASDFYHGPFAIVDQNTTTLLIAPAGNSQKDMQDLKEKLLGVGAKVLIITNQKQLAIGADGGIVYDLQGSDYITPFYNVVVAQMWACAMSLARGLNPDAPRGLQKVTITK